MFAHVLVGDITIPVGDSASVVNSSIAGSNTTIPPPTSRRRCDVDYRLAGDAGHDVVLCIVCDRRPDRTAVGIEILGEFVQRRVGDSGYVSVDCLAMVACRLDFRVDLLITVEHRWQVHHFAERNRLLPAIEIGGRKTQCRIYMLPDRDELTQAPDQIIGQQLLQIHESVTNQNVTSAVMCLSTNFIRFIQPISYIPLAHAF